MPVPAEIDHSKLVLSGIWIVMYLQILVSKGFKQKVLQGLKMVKVLSKKMLFFIALHKN
jgi:hypothetical protein